MRCGLVMVVVGCGQGAEPSTPVDADPHCAPTAPDWCKPHGLVGIDLAGTWTLTAMRTDDHCMVPPGTTTDSITKQLTFTVDGCVFQQIGGIDDTVAVDTHNLTAQMYYSTETVCVDAVTGALTYISSATMRCIPTNGTPENQSIVGTLTR